jgi:hypothetical protein
VFDCIMNNRSDELTCDIVFNCLSFFIAVHQNYDEEITFCSSYFFEFDSSHLSGLNFEILELIISNGSLRLKDENSLFNFLRIRF